MCYLKEQKEKDKNSVKLHKGFALILQVLLHTDILTRRSPDGTVSAETLLSECQSSTSDLCQICSIFFGNHLTYPRPDIFDKATGLSVSHSTSFGFLTKADSETAMAIARQ